jgi:hypothetical protein
MDEEKRKRLEAKGFKVGTVAEFLGLSAEEEAAVEIHAALARLLRDKRTENPSPQTAPTGQTRVSETEFDDPGASTDTLLLALLRAGVTLQQIGETIAAVTITQDLPAARREETERESEVKLAATG